MAFSRSRKLANIGKAIDSGVSGDFLGLDDSGGIFKDVQWNDITGKPTILDSAATIAIIDSAYVQARQTDVGIDSGQITNLVDSAYVQLRVGDIGLDSAAATGIVDSAYVAARVTAGLDSAATLSLVDSDYVSARASASSGFEYFKYIATAGQTVFDSTDEYGNTLSYGTDNILVFYNGVLMLPTYDYTTSGGDTVTLNEGADSGIPVTIGKWAVGSSSSSSSSFYLANATRAVYGGGYNNSVYLNTIEYVTISSTGNATDFGDLITERAFGYYAVSDNTYGLFAGGVTTGTSTRLNSIEYITIASTGNASDFGDLTVGRSDISSVGDGTYGVGAGGKDGSNSRNEIDYVTIATPGNASDFGDLTLAREFYASSGASDGTYGVFAGGYDNAGSTSVNIIDYITIASTGNATDFGDTLNAAYGMAGISNETYGIFAGEQATAVTNVIQYVTIATPGNASDFGDLTEAKRSAAGAENSTRGLIAGGWTGSARVNTIEYITPSTPGNGTDFGDLTEGKNGGGFCSGT